MGFGRDVVVWLFMFTVVACTVPVVFVCINGSKGSCFEYELLDMVAASSLLYASLLNEAF